MRLGPQDKAFITAELKRMARLKNREYLKKGKSEKYLKLKKQFEVKYKEEAAKYLRKSLEGIRDSSPGQAFSVLKKLGAQPGECLDSGLFPSLLMRMKTYLTSNRRREWQNILRQLAKISRH